MYYYCFEISGACIRQNILMLKLVCVFKCVQYIYRFSNLLKSSMFSFNKNITEQKVR